MLYKEICIYVPSKGMSKWERETALFDQWIPLNPSLTTSVTLDNLPSLTMFWFLYSKIKIVAFTCSYYQKHKIKTFHTVSALVCTQIMLTVHFSIDIHLRNSRILRKTGHGDTEGWRLEMTSGWRDSIVRNWQSQVQYMCAVCCRPRE
jgi:hypothetical protein